MLVDWEQMLSYMTHHPRWFENFTRRSPSSDFLRHYREIMPGGWPLRRHGYWMIAEPPDTPMPDQGWKLHVSATSGTGADTLRLALPVLRDAGVRFKFLMDPAALMEANGKSYGRGSSGKFIAVYPADEQQFHAVAEDLTKALAGFEGPYILSDRRYPGSRVVFYRYGGFKSLPKLRPTGLRELMIAEPDGTLVRDLRTPYWSMPDWADDPVARKFAPSREIDSETTALAGGRFTVESAISFSNRGGIYKGIDTEAGAEVVLREARPGVQVGPKGRDAVDLLRHEYDLLSDLADTGLFVRPISFFTQWEHAFVAQEYIEGSHIGYLSITQNPVYSLDLSPESLTEYYQRFRGLWLQVAEAVAVAHERGIVLGDLSTTNVMVTPDDKVQVIDLECAFHEGVDEGARMCTWGMVTKKAATSQTGDRRSDYYALGGVLLSCVLVCAQVDAVNRDIPRQLLKEVAADLNLPVELTSLIEDLRDEDAPLPDPDVIRKRIADIPFGTAWQTAPPLARSRWCRIQSPVTACTNGSTRRSRAWWNTCVRRLISAARTACSPPTCWSSKPTRFRWRTARTGLSMPCTYWARRSRIRSCRGLYDTQPDTMRCHPVSTTGAPESLGRCPRWATRSWPSRPCVPLVSIRFYWTSQEFWPDRPVTQWPACGSGETPG